MSDSIENSYNLIPWTPVHRDVIIHSRNRRAFWQDYKSRCIYMVTITRHDSLTFPFSHVVNAGLDGDGRIKAMSRLTRCGRVICKELYRMEQFYEEVRILKSEIMPDHLHFIIFVREHLPIGLGGVVKFFKGNCTKHLRQAFPDFAATGLPVFGDGYNDRIVFRKGALDTMMNYVTDNPRRLLLRQMYPSFFRKVCRLEIGGSMFDAYGNLDLLYEPVKSPLIISRRYSESERKEYEEEWAETARCGGVLVSPFISSAEKEKRNELLEQGASVIHIVDYGFGERYKPSGKMFDLCASGRLLLLSEISIRTDVKEMKRERALHMNDTARWLVAFTKPDSVVIKGKRTG